MNKTRFIKTNFTWLFIPVLTLILVLSSCAGPPKKSIEAAEKAISRAKAEVSTPDCLQKLTSAEAFLEKARRAMEKKDYEKAKTEVFDSLQEAYEAHQCAEQNQNKNQTD